MHFKIIIKLLESNNIHGLDAFYYIINLYNKKCVNEYNIILPNIETDYLNNIFLEFIHNDNLLNLKDYFKFYNNQKLVKWITQIIPIKTTDIIFDGNIKINSYGEYLIKNNYTSVYGNQNNEIILSLNNYHTYKNNDLLYDDIKHNYDIIFFDFPNDIHNKIHALCCKKIKQLKIRGTKAEPLLLQWVCTSLNKNGKAIIVVPDSLLYGDSTQHIETRKYLFNNFNIKRIIQIDESIYNYNINRDIKSITSVMKNSILYFENNGATTNILFEKISINKEIILEQITNLNTLDDIYSLYYKNYNNINIDNKIEYNEINNIYNIYKSIKDIPVQKVLCVPIYYNNNLVICEHNQIINDNNNIYITDKNTNDNSFILKYIKSIIINKNNLFIKGKMNKIDIDKLRKYKIPILTNNIKETISKYLDISEEIINNNLHKINMYNELKITFINTIPTNKRIKLNDIGIITNKNEDNIIGFVKNSLLAGTVFIPDRYLSTNSHYFKITNINYLVMYLYYFLKYQEKNIMEVAKLTSQPSLNKADILNLSVLDINIENQKEIIETCDSIDNSITILKKEIETIKNKDIINIILKLYNC